MRIIKEGFVTEDLEYEATCKRCKTVFVFQRKEANYGNDYRLTGEDCPTGSALVINCPLCRHQVFRYLEIGEMH
jgi:hypothetical protein